MWRVRRTVSEEDLSTNTRPAGVKCVRHAPMTQLRIRLKSQPQGPRPPSLSAFPARSHHFLANLNLSVTLAIASSALPLSASSSVTPHPTPPPSRRALCSPPSPVRPGLFFFFFNSPAGCFPLIFTASPLAPYSHRCCACSVYSSSACSRIVFHHFILSASVSRWVPRPPASPQHMTLS